MFSETDTAYLCRRVKEGRVVLFLGAGASVGSKNGNHDPIKTGGQLQAALRSRLSKGTDDLDLGELYSAYTDVVGDKSAIELLTEEYSDCSPGPALIGLLGYSWRRIYTLNIDDAVEKSPRVRRAQKIETISRKARIEDKRTFERVEVVHLNGYINRPDDGFIFTAEQYQEELLNNSNWYRQSAEDFLDNTFVFIGTKLDEPVFKAHVQNITKETGMMAGRSFLVIPDDVSDTKRDQLAKKNISVEKGDLSSFVQFLKKNIGDGLTPLDVIRATSRLPLKDELLGRVSSDLKSISSDGWLRSNSVDADIKSKLGRDFYNGFAPEWRTVIAGVPAVLKHDALLASEIDSFLKSTNSLFFVVGASGTGKTTALMKYCLSKILKAEIQIFHLEDRSRADISDVLSAINSVEGGQKILFIDNISLFADGIPVLQRLSQQYGIKVITQVRAGEWNSRVEKYCDANISVWRMPNLASDDYEHLREGLVKYAIAPKFRGMGKEDQLAALKKAKHQLLALMKDVTGQRGFEELIESEYRAIPDQGARFIYCVVGLGALGKGRFTPGEIVSISRYFNDKFNPTESLAQLTDLVGRSADGYLVGRHDIIIRHVLETAASGAELAKCIVALLQYFRAFGEPVIAHLDRQRGNVFKYIINYNFLYDIFKKKGDIAPARVIYEAIEKDYQQDGLYWLQRGLFFRRAGRGDAALEFLERSVQAYPQSHFARHALAQQRLLMAAKLRDTSQRAQTDVRLAVEELNKQDEERAMMRRDPEAEEYPLVTLTQGHIDYLVAVGKLKEAKQFAKEYYERLTVLANSIPRENRYVENLRQACMKFWSTGVWGPKSSGAKMDGNSRRR